ncbi:MAG: ATP-grasp domain-containing protein, partial [Chloroflexota bacterium]
MILVDKPYLSKFLKETSRKHDLPIIHTPAAREMGINEHDNIITEEEAVAQFHKAKNQRIYTTSENAIGWIAENLSFTTLP